MRYSLGKTIGVLRGSAAPGTGDCLIESISREEFLKRSSAKQLPGYFSNVILDAQFTRAELFGAAIAGAFLIPEKEDLLGPAHSFGYYFTEGTVTFVDDGGYAEAVLNRLMGYYSAPAASVGHFFFAFLEALIEEDRGFLQRLEEDVSDLEELILSDPSPRINQKLLQIRKRLIRLTDYYDQLSDLGEILQNDESGLLAKEDQRRMQLFANRAAHLTSSAELLEEYTVQMRELYQSQIDIRQNTIMTVLTVVTTIFMPLTLIAGWYGMNFINMPELHWRHGYAIIAIASAVIILIEIWIFKRKKFL